MARVPLYVSGNNMSRLLGDVLDTFPTIYLRGDGDKGSLFTEVLDPLLVRSLEFCQEIVDSNMTMEKEVATGGFSQVSSLLFLKDGERRKIKMATMSYDVDGESVIWFLDVFAKKPIGDAPPQQGIVYKRSKGKVIYTASDPVYESIVGSLTSYLFDAGVAPSLMKYVGIYVCAIEDPTDELVPAVPFLLFEKSDIQFIDLLGGPMGTKRHNPIYENMFLNSTPYDHMIWALQIIHSLTVAKSAFGLAHIDLHLRNIMMTKTADTNLTENMADREFYYGGKRTADVKYYEYELPFLVNDQGTISDKGTRRAVLLLENNGLLPKIIDWGGSSVDFSKSLQNSTIPIEFRNDPNAIDRLFMGHAATTTKNIGDVDVNFFLINLMYQMCRTVTHPDHFYNSNPKLYDKAKELLKSIFGFMVMYILPDDYSNSFEELIHKGEIQKGGEIKAMNRDGTEIVREFFNDYGGDLFFMKYRNVGTTPNLLTPLSKAWVYLRSKKFDDGSSRGRLGDSSFVVMITRDNLPPVENVETIKVPFSPTGAKKSVEVKVMTSTLGEIESCTLGGFRTQEERDKISLYLFGVQGLDNEGLCAALQSNKIPKKLYGSFFKNIVSRGSEIWSRHKQTLITTITKPALSRSGLIKASLGNLIAVYTIKMIPPMLETNKITKEEIYGYPAGALLPNHKRPQIDLIGTRLKMINIHPIYISKNTPVIGTCSDLTASELLQMVNSENQGMTISLGYMIDEHNLENPLTPDLPAGYPIGYFYNETSPEYNGTHLPIPQAYKPWFATVYIDDNSQLKMMRSVEFDLLHKTVEIETAIAINPILPDPDDEILEIDSLPGVIIGFDNEGKPLSSFPYKFAAEMGPIIVWGGKIMFDAVTQTQDFVKDNQLVVYRLDPKARNYEKFFSEEGEMNFPYHQRNSNYLIARNVLAETNSGDFLILLVEGTPGLDRAQLTELVLHFDVKNAVCIGSSDVVFKNPMLYTSVANQLVSGIWRFTDSETPSKISLTFVV